MVFFHGQRENATFGNRVLENVYACSVFKIFNSVSVTPIPLELQALEEPTKPASGTEGTALDTHSEVVMLFSFQIYICKQKAKFNWVVHPPFTDVLACPAQTTNRRVVCCHWSSPAGPLDYGNPSVWNGFTLFLSFCLLSLICPFSVENNFPAPVWVFSKFSADEHRVRCWQGRSISPPPQQVLFSSNYKGRQNQ